ncbi:MAG TPA: hypothetical protein VGF56_04665 [Rhizomicrobium sp.]
MERPMHASDDVDRDQNVPRMIAVGVGLAILVVAGVTLAYSGLWAPPATAMHTASAATTH